MKEGNQRERAQYRIEFQGLSSELGGLLPGPGPALHHLRNDFALLLAVVRPRLPALRYRSCLSLQRRGDRALIRGLPDAPRKPPQGLLDDLHDLFAELDKGDFSRPRFDRICGLYQELFLPVAVAASEAD